MFRPLNYVLFIQYFVIEFWCLNEQGLGTNKTLQFRKNDSLIFSKIFFKNPLVEASEMFLGGTKDSMKFMPSPIVISDNMQAISLPRYYPTIRWVVKFNHQWLSILVSFLL
jgi:hypothetical protein